MYKETNIKAIRKARHCDGCCAVMEVGQPAVKCSGVGNEGFWHATYHHECRKAEVELNRLHDVGWQDDWISLPDVDWEDYAWLIQEYPDVADRMKITTERYEKIRDESDRIWMAWAEVYRVKAEAERISSLDQPPLPR